MEQNIKKEVRKHMKKLIWNNKKEKSIESKKELKNKLINKCRSEKSKENLDDIIKFIEDNWESIYDEEYNFDQQSESSINNDVDEQYEEILKWEEEALLDTISRLIL